MPLPPLCLENVASRRQAALVDRPWRQDGLTDGASLVKLVLRGSLPGSGMPVSGMVPVPFLSAGLSLPPTVLSSLVYSRPCFRSSLPRGMPWSPSQVLSFSLYNFELFGFFSWFLSSNTSMPDCM